MHVVNTCNNRQNIEDKLEKIQTKNQMKYHMHVVNTCNHKQEIEDKLEKKCIFINNKNSVLAYSKFLTILDLFKKLLKKIEKKIRSIFFWSIGLVDRISLLRSISEVSRI